MLGQRPGRWSNSKTTLDLCLVFVGSCWLRCQAHQTTGWCRKTRPCSPYDNSAGTSHWPIDSPMLVQLLWRWYNIELLLNYSIVRYILFQTKSTDLTRPTGNTAGSTNSVTHALLWYVTEPLQDEANKKKLKFHWDRHQGITRAQIRVRKCGIPAVFT